MRASRRTERHALAAGAWCLGLASVLGLGVAVAQQPAALAEKGEKVFMEQGCYGCHTVGKVGTQGVAADLSHIGARHDLAYLRTWLADPAAQRPTAHMPRIQMSKADLDAVATYLATLR